MTDIHFMVVLMGMLQLRNVFTWRNFLIKKFCLLNCLKIFNAFVQTHLEFVIETLAGLNLYRRPIEF